MIYLSSWCPELAVSQSSYLGLMVSPGRGNSRPVATVRVWAADNGCFSSARKFREATFLNWLGDLSMHAPRCLFAVAPDVVGDAAGTWERSAPVLPRIREHGYKAAYVAQDGFRPEGVDWEAFDVLFIGGTTEWKLGMGHQATAWSLEHGKPVHMGRVNSIKRLEWAAGLGCTSADGSMFVFGGSKYMGRIKRALTRANLRRPT